MREGGTPSAKRKKLGFGQDQNITVVVGSEDTKFTVHKSILTTSSDFFKACCDGSGTWKETASKTVQLPEADAPTFEIYVQWLYTRELVVCEEYDTDELKDKEKESRVAAFNSWWPRLHKLAVLGDRLSDVLFSNIIVDWMIKVSDDLEMLPMAYLQSLYSDLPETAMARRMMVDNLVSCAQEGMLATCKDDLPPDCLFEMVIAFDEIVRGQKSKMEPKWESRCDYHVHNDKVPKCT